MKKPVNLVVVLPVGPLGGGKYKLDDLFDTLDSIIHYTSPRRQIILQDNTEQDLGQWIHELYPDITVIRSPQNYGLSGGLYKAESIAFLYAQATFNFKLLVRMDMDALLIDYGLEDAV